MGSGYTVSPHLSPLWFKGARFNPPLVWLHRAPHALHHHVGGAVRRCEPRAEMDEDYSAASEDQGWQGCEWE